MSTFFWPLVIACASLFGCATSQSPQPVRRALMDPTRRPLAPLLPRSRTAMKALIGVLLATVVTGSGCAKTDWIDRTLVTVDVTGRWTGKWFGASGVGGGGDFRMTLQQTGPKAAGNVEMNGVADSYNWNGPIVGAVKGDVLSFSNGRMTGEVTVAEDEMSGTVTFTPVSASGCCPGGSLLGTRTLKLQRQP